MKELVDHFALFGTIEEYHALDEYPAEEFTEVYLIKFQRIQTARVAKRKLDERSFFGGVLHVCYAPEFESVQETREKLHDRKRFIARVTSDKDYLVSRKLHPKPAAPKAFEHHYQHETSQFSLSVACTTSTNQYQQQCYQFEPLLSQPTSRNLTVSSAGDHLQRELRLPPYVSDSMKTNTSFSHKTKWMQGIQGTNNNNNNTTYSPSDNGINQFMPRTTQLQERKRKRDQADSCSLFGAGLDEEIIIGPKFPEIPKVDMEDDSLNVSANAIRSKLKKRHVLPKELVLVVPIIGTEYTIQNVLAYVGPTTSCSSCMHFKVSLMPMPTPEVKQKEDTAVNPLTKPRRRI